MRLKYLKLKDEEGRVSGDAKLEPVKNGKLGES